MILIDSSIWIDHLRHGDAGLVRLLESGQALTHPFVIGELAMGSLHERDSVIALLYDLPSAIAADDREVLGFIDRHALFGLGIGYVDAHLLASVQLTPDARLWTRDRRLRDAAVRLGIAALQPSGEN